MGLKKTREEILRLPLTNRVKVSKDCLCTFTCEAFTDSLADYLYTLTQTVHGYCIEVCSSLESKKSTIQFKNKCRFYKPSGLWRKLREKDFVIVQDDDDDMKFYLIPMEEALSPAEFTWYKVGYSIGRPLYDDLGYKYKDKFNTSWADFENASDVMMLDVDSEDYVRDFVSVAKKGDSEVFWFVNE